MERYQVTTNKDSGIKNDPNEWDTTNPRYILDLLLSIIRVSTETVAIVKSLPKLKFGSNGDEENNVVEEVAADYGVGMAE